MRSEDLLLRRLSRIDIGPDEHRAFKALTQPGPDWDFFLTRARQELLSPLVFKAFLKIDSARHAVREDIWECFRDDYYSTAGSNITRAAQLERIITGLAGSGIRAILCKGLILVYHVYGDVGARPSGDIDLVIRTADVLAADGILKSLHYQAVSATEDLSEIRSSPYRNSLLYFHDDGQAAPVHLHWHIVNSMPHHRSVFDSIDMDVVWRSARSTRVESTPVLTFSLPHQVIYLSLHALSHSFYPLILLCDINELIRREGARIDWDEVVVTARSFSLSRYVYYALYLVSEIVRGPVPDSVLQALAPARQSIFEKRFVSRFLRGKPVVNDGWLMYVGMNETLAGRLAFLRRAAVPSREEMGRLRTKDPSRVTLRDYVSRIVRIG